MSGQRIKGLYGYPFPRHDAQRSGSLRGLYYCQIKDARQTLLTQTKPRQVHLWSKNRETAGSRPSRKCQLLRPRLNGTKNAKRPLKKFKHYLETPLVLILAVPGKPLILYLTVLEESMGGSWGNEMPLGKNMPSTTSARNSQNMSKDTQH
ncbi:hypothetical protein CR513_57162, partial [Mucuna pruriens]